MAKFLMSTKKALLIFVPVIVALLAIMIAVTTVMYSFSGVMNKGKEYRRPLAARTPFPSITTAFSTRTISRRTHPRRLRRKSTRT